MTDELVKQTRNAFDFVQKLYFETSYLIKEVEGLLRQEEENFELLKPSGYMVTNRTSSGLEAVNVENWLPKTSTVFFGPGDMTEITGAKTTTRFDDTLKLLLLPIELLGQHLDAPRVIGGIIVNIQSKKLGDTRFEQLTTEFAYQYQKIFASSPTISFDSNRFSFEGKYFVEPLFSINNSDDVTEKLILPMLKLYRGE